jgi:hypothetical protein
VRDKHCCCSVHNGEGSRTSVDQKFDHRGRAEALLNRDASNVKISLCAVMTRNTTDRVMGAHTLRFGTYPSDSLQPGSGPVDPTSHSASHSGPGPLADTKTKVRVPHGSWRDDAARVVRSSLMSTEVSLATSLYATWIVLISQPTIPAACRRPSRLCAQTLVCVCARACSCGRGRAGERGREGERRSRQSLPARLLRKTGGCAERAAAWLLAPSWVRGCGCCAP